MKQLKALVFALLLPLAAYAEEKADIRSDLVGIGVNPEVAFYLSNLLADGNVIYDNADYIKWRNAADSANINAFRVNGSDDTVMNADSGDVGVFSVATTPIAGFDSNNVLVESGKGFKLASYVPTMAATAVAGTNQILPGLNIVPTAAANTVAMTRATPVIGEKSVIYNSNSANAVRIKAGGASTINGSAAGAYVELAAAAGMQCETVGAAALLCTTLTTTAMATPAGP